MWDAFPYANPETLEFAYCDTHYQYVLLTYTDILITRYIYEGSGSLIVKISALGMWVRTPRTWLMIMIPHMTPVLVGSRNQTRE